MKKLSALLLVVLLSVCLTAVCYAATGEELLKQAEMYLTFEDSYADTNGKVEVQTEEGKGTRFIITLPTLTRISQSDPEN